MVAIKGVAHFSIPVSDVARSARFYTEVVGCRHLSTTPERADGVSRCGWYLPHPGQA
jgi:catechol 2,3-dioxygenase-like lactoylglutathione lyase family enzyme